MKKTWHERNRKRVQKANNDYYQRNKSTIATKRKQQRQEERLKRMVAEVNGQEVRLYTIREFCNLIGRATSTVKLWELRKVTPPPLFSNDAHQRLYSQQEVDLYDTTLQLYPRDLDALSNAIWNGVAKLKEEFGL